MHTQVFEERPSTHNDRWKNVRTHSLTGRGRQVRPMSRHCANLSLSCSIFQYHGFVVTSNRRNCGENPSRIFGRIIGRIVTSTVASERGWMKNEERTGVKWRLFKRSAGVNHPCPLESGSDVTANARSLARRIAGNEYANS